MDGASINSPDRLSKIKVGVRLSIYWNGNDVYYPGVVIDRHRDHVYTIQYDEDGAKETYDMSNELFRIITGCEHLLPQICKGVMLEIYWEEDDKYYPGVVVEHHGGHDYTIRYDDGEKEKIDMAEEKFRIVGSADEKQESESEGSNRTSDEDEIGHLAQLLSQISVGTTEVAVLWPEYGRYYSGKVTEHHHDHVYTIKYDTGLIKQTDMSKVEEFRIVSGTPYSFWDESYEIYWPTKGNVPVGTGQREEEVGWGWRLFSLDQDKVKFYSCSFSTMRCEVEWHGNGIIIDTEFRVAKRRARNKIDNSMYEAQTKQVKRSQGTNDGSMISKNESEIFHSNNAEKQKPQKTSNPTKYCLGLHPDQPHYITDKLQLSREKIISTLPSEMISILGNCCWVPWKSVQRPALCITPFDLKGNSGILEEWVSKYVSLQRQGLVSQMPRLVYWYEEGWSTSKDFKAFGFVGKEKLFPYEIGVANGWLRPSFCKKVTNPFEHGMLTEEEDAILIGIKQMERDSVLPKSCRGG
ncbi:hypothetical protein ACHAWF_008869 [Thalassiosira exigua]